MTQQEAYEALKTRFRETSLVHSAMAVLGWDERVNMPKGGSEFRAQQLAYLAGLSHEKATAPEIGEWLATVESGELCADPVSDTAVNVREWRRNYDRESKVPKSLVEEFEHAATVGQNIWTEARARSDFEMFVPALTRLVDLAKRVADAVGYANEPYDAMLEYYDPGSTAKDIAVILGGLRDELVPLVEAITNSPKQPKREILSRDFPVDRQELFGRAAAAAIGFDFASGRLDKTTHPFCSGFGPGDCRITTRYDQNSFGQAFFGVLHEAGHGMYEQGLDAGHYGTPRADSVSYGIHESQSRMWENSVGRSRAFWVHFFPRARQVFPESLGDVSFDEFYFAINDVQKQFIRVEADEVTYNLHILLRFEMEAALFRNELEVKDIPGTWNEKFKAMFGIVPPDDAQGCLQDIHWSAGLFGYFPSYSLGNIYAAQIFAQAEKDMPNLYAEFEAGRFGALLDWLRKHVHSLGQTYRAPQLVEKISGTPPTHKALVDELKGKFGPLYGV